MHPTVARYHVDPRRPDVTAALLGCLATHGIATVSGVVDRQAALVLAWSVGMVVSHRDADAAGVTVLAGTEPAPQFGYAGLSRRQLAPHTDGTAVTRPPTLVMLVCARPALSGGEALLVDGRAVFTALQEHAPDAARAFTRPDAARFGSSPGRLSPIFEVSPADRVVVRFRDDDLAVFSPHTHAALPTLRRLIADHTIVLPLEAGQGYLVQNGWWLHGRTRFASQRLAWRILIEPWPFEQGFPLIESGFAALEPTPASTQRSRPP
jgi:Taurine catabolism dioxygenase TauD, TfdA family